MDEASIRLMFHFRRGWLPAKADTKLLILDVGAIARAASGNTYRSIFDRSFTYHGFDVGEKGPNVDVVGYDSLRQRSYDVIVDGQTLVQAPQPYKWVANLRQYLKPEGFICLVAPHTTKSHRDSSDLFRILPAGMKDLLVTAGFINVEVEANDTNTLGIGRNPKP